MAIVFQESTQNLLHCHDGKFKTVNHLIGKKCSAYKNTIYQFENGRLYRDSVELVKLEGIQVGELIAADAEMPRERASFC